MKAAELASILLRSPQDEVFVTEQPHAGVAQRCYRKEDRFYVSTLKTADAHVENVQVHAPLVSPRGFVLLGDIPTKAQRPLITVELYPKWYELFIVRPQAPHVQRLDFADLTCVVNSSVTLFVDHVPNPLAVHNFAIERDYEVHELAMELIAGRWMLEVEST